MNGIGARYVEALLSKMKPLEPVSMITILAVLLAAAFVDVGVPALRASMLDPAETLREE